MNIDLYSSCKDGEKLFKKIKKGDLVIAVILLVAVTGWYFVGMVGGEKENKALVIQVNGKVVDRIPLNLIAKQTKKEIILEDGKYIRFSYGPEGVFVEDVVCPNKICVKRGIIKDVGESIVCLPNKTIALITGDYPDK